MLDLGPFAVTGKSSRGVGELTTTRCMAMVFDATPVSQEASGRRKHVGCVCVLGRTGVKRPRYSGRKVDVVDNH